MFKEMWVKYKFWFKYGKGIKFQKRVDIIFIIIKIFGD